MDILEATNGEGEESYGNTDRKRFITREEEKGMVVLYPKDNELFIDCDTEEHFSNFIELFEILNNNVKIFDPPGEKYYEEIEIWESKGGSPGKHIIVPLPFDVSSVERIAYQAALGSDPKREILSLIRLKNGDDFPTIFVEKPGFEGRK